MTHILTGTCLARTGLHRRIRYATVAMAIAAEFPEIDVLWGLRGPVASLQHHRGITHTFLGLPLEAAVILSGFLLWHRLRQHTVTTRDAAPVRWVSLYACLLLALLTHLLLDYTNSYGVRPFFPLNPHWYAASIVFIFDPLLFLFLLAGLVFPAFTSLIGQEISSSRRAERGVLWPRLALCAVVCLWAVRTYEHAKAVDLAQQQSYTAAPDPGTSTPSPPRSTFVARRTLASPDPLSIFRWYTASDFGPAYRLAEVDTRTDLLTPGQAFEKPDLTPALTSAEASPLGRVYLDWSSMPWLSLVPAPDPGGTSGQTVIFQDLRFMGGPSLLHRGDTPPPLSGSVLVAPNGAILEQVLDGKQDPQSP